MHCGQGCFDYPQSCPAANTANFHAVLDDRINHAAVLFPGVACFLIAAITGLFLHASNMDDVRAKLGNKTGGWLSKAK